MEHWERIQMENMTAQEWANHKHSFEYVSSKWLYSKSKTEGLPYYRSMLDRLTASNLVAWVKAVDSSLTVLLADQDSDLSATDRDNLAWDMAEQSLVLDNKIPPHWTAKTSCPLCGDMPCAPGRENHPCPWDTTDIGRVAREIRGIE